MTDTESGAKPKVRDFWETVELFSKVFATVAIPVIGMAATYLVNANQEEERQARLYSELLSKREQSENELRTGMFQNVLKSFSEEQSQATLNKWKGGTPSTSQDRGAQTNNLKTNPENAAEKVNINEDGDQSAGTPENKTEKNFDRIFRHAKRKAFVALEANRFKILNIGLVARNFYEFIDIKPIFDHALLDIVVPRAEFCGKFVRFDGNLGKECMAINIWNIPDFTRRCPDRNADRRSLREETGSSEWDRQDPALCKVRQISAKFMKQLADLINIARRITGKQVESLSHKYGKLTAELREEQITEPLCKETKPFVPSPVTCQPVKLKSSNLTIYPSGKKDKPLVRKFTICALQSYFDWASFKVAVVQQSPTAAADSDPCANLNASGEDPPPQFWVNFFDFPTTDNTALSDKERYAVFLKDMSPDDTGKNKATLELIYYPSTLAGLKEKSYYHQRILGNLETAPFLKPSD